MFKLGGSEILGDLAQLLAVLLAILKETKALEERRPGWDHIGACWRNCRYLIVEHIRISILFSYPGVFNFRALLFNYAWAKMQKK